MARTGRKRKGYFYEEQERAVSDYLNAHTKEERDRIFNEWLRPAFTKMIESIIRRYKLYLPNEDFAETFDDTISFLMTKIEKFDTTKGYKAYSYCGTICKNYLLYRLNQFNKHQEKEEAYNDMYDICLENRKVASYAFAEPTHEDFLNALIAKTRVGIEEILNKPEENSLKENEKKVGQALVELLKNWEEILEDNGSNKFNKSSITLYLRDMTQLSTTEIRSCMKKYKNAYYFTKKEMIEEDEF
jgi:hypothetical protein